MSVFILSTALSPILSKGLKILLILNRIIWKCLEKKKLACEYVISVLKHMIIVSNSNSVKSADGLLSRMGSDTEIKWISKDKKRVDKSKYKVSYWVYRLKTVWFVWRITGVVLSYCSLVDVLNFGCVYSNLLYVSHRDERYKKNKAMVATFVNFDSWFDIVTITFEKFNDDVRQLFLKCRLELVVYTLLEKN